MRRGAGANQLEVSFILDHGYFLLLPLLERHIISTCLPSVTPFLRCRFLICQNWLVSAERGWSMWCARLFVLRQCNFLRWLPPIRDLDDRRWTRRRFHWCCRCGSVLKCWRCGSVLNLESFSYCLQPLAHSTFQLHISLRDAIISDQMFHYDWPVPFLIVEHGMTLLANNQTPMWFRIKTDKFQIIG